MHEASFAATVLTALRSTSGPHARVRLHVWDTSTPAEELAERVVTYLAAADPPVRIPALEVVPQPRQRLCAACATEWTSTEADPACPACGGASLPLPHDHRLEIELVQG